LKCQKCHTNSHTLPSCPFLKNWIIKKKPRPETPREKSTWNNVRSAVACISSNLETVPEESFEENFDSNVESDLLPDDVDNQAVTCISGEVFP
jgi:hypothetical protein